MRVVWTGAVRARAVSWCRARGGRARARASRRLAARVDHCPALRHSVPCPGVVEAERSGAPVACNSLDDVDDNSQHIKLQGLYRGAAHGPARGRVTSRSGAAGAGGPDTSPRTTSTTRRAPRGAAAPARL